MSNTEDIISFIISVRPNLSKLQKQENMEFIRTISSFFDVILFRMAVRDWTAMKLKRKSV